VTKRAKSVAKRVQRVAAGVAEQTVAGAEKVFETAKEFVQEHT
jgi:hypothetical protein